jgi:hypothetical protein
MASIDDHSEYFAAKDALHKMKFIDSRLGPIEPVFNYTATGMSSHCAVPDIANHLPEPYLETVYHLPDYTDPTVIDPWLSTYNSEPFVYTTNDGSQDTWAKEWVNDPSTNGDAELPEWSTHTPHEAYAGYNMTGTESMEHHM